MIPTSPFTNALYPTSFTMASVTTVILYNVTNQLFNCACHVLGTYSVEHSRKVLLGAGGRSGYGLVQRCIPAVAEKFPEKRTIIRSTFSS
jgi:hypothetical protein